MATAAAPLFHSTKETTNYASLCRLLVDVGAHILRETFDKRRPTGNLDAVLSSPPVHAVLRSLRHKRILNPSQWGKLYPAIKSAVSSNSFDISLLMVLLRKICGLAPPATGWDTPPPEADTTLEADIVRIKCYIYTVYSHASEASVDDPTFSQYWQDIQDALVRLGGAGYQSAIDDLKKEYMDPDLEEPYKQRLKQCVMCEVSIKERLYEIGKSEVELKKAAVNPEKKAGDKAPEEEKSLEVEEYSSSSTDQDVRQKEEAARNVDERKTVIKRGKIADESETWNLAKAGASITFNLGAITKSLTITCSLWTPAALSPPIGSNELLVSNVIELSHDGPPDLEFMENDSGSIDVALLHSASNSKGYEVVIKQLVDPEYNEWEDLETKTIWHSSVHPTIPNWTCPSAKASCSKRWFSSFAAVWRLKSFVFLKPTSKTSEFICSLPDYPNVSVAIPWNSLPVDTDFSLTLKVQEAPTIDHNVEGMLVGPILHISCSNNVKLSVPAKISLPLSLTDGEIELAELHSGQVKILHFNSREESQEWTDITDHLDMPVVLRDGIVTFQVKTFCRFWPWLLKTFVSTPWKYATLLYDGIMKRHAGFLACLCSDAVPARYVLKMFCFPQHLRFKVNSDISSYFVNMQGEGTSEKPLSSGDETCVSLSSGFEVQGARNVEDIVLKFLGSEHFLASLRVSIKDPSDLQVDFLKSLGNKERKNSPILCQVPIIPRSPVQLSVFEEGSGISAQSVRHSIVEQPNSESSLCSPVAASDKRKRYLVKAYGPSADELDNLSVKLGKKWEELGRRLGFDVAAIDNFNEGNEGLAKKAFKMLMAWKQKEGSDATYKVLYDALCNEIVQCKLLAEEFCCDEIVGNASA